jgi:hypothetical protein
MKKVYRITIPTTISLEFTVEAENPKDALNKLYAPNGNIPCDTLPLSFDIDWNEEGEDTDIGSLVIVDWPCYLPEKKNAIVEIDKDLTQIVNQLDNV